MVLLYYAVWRSSLSISIALMSIALMTWRQTKVVQFIVYCRSIRDGSYVLYMLMMKTALSPALFHGERTVYGVNILAV